jgi:predicted membrane protein
MTFIASVVLSIFDILGNTYFGEFSLLTIFASILFFTIALSLLFSYLGIGFNAELQDYMQQNNKMFTRVQNRRALRNHQRNNNLRELDKLNRSKK